MEAWKLIVVYLAAAVAVAGCETTGTGSSGAGYSGTYGASPELVSAFADFKKAIRGTATEEMATAFIGGNYTDSWLNMMPDAREMNVTETKNVYKYTDVQLSGGVLSFAGHDGFWPPGSGRDEMDRPMRRTIDLAKVYEVSEIGNMKSGAVDSETTLFNQEGEIEVLNPVFYFHVRGGVAFPGEGPILNQSDTPTSFYRDTYEQASALRSAVQRMVKAVQ